MSDNVTMKDVYDFEYKRYMYKISKLIPDLFQYGKELGIDERIIAHDLLSTIHNETNIDIYGELIKKTEVGK
jgi:hypothetical protein